MSAIWQFIICAILSLLAIVGGASLAAMSFAIASFRFLNLKDKDSNKESLSGVGKFCVYNSERMASVISLSAGKISSRNHNCELNEIPLRLIEA